MGILIIILLGIMIYSVIEKETYNIDKGINPPRGNIDSDIIVIEFSDFQCPACKGAEPIIKEILEDYDVVFYYRNFPLPMHKDSFIAAEAAECANEQNRFWEYHDVLFENQDKLDKGNLKLYAQELGLNAEQFNDCLDSEKYKPEITKDIRDGKASNVRGTPTFFVNEKKVVGANEVLIRQIIEDI